MFQTNERSGQKRQKQYNRFHRFFINFSLKKRWISGSRHKLRVNWKNSTENSCFLVPAGKFWVPRCIYPAPKENFWDPKDLQNGIGTLRQHPPGTNLGSFWAPDRFFLDFGSPFGCLWTPFGVPQGFILRKTVMNFQSFSWFRLVGRIGLLVVVLGCLARLVGLVG